MGVLLKPSGLLHGEDGGKRTQVITILTATLSVFICGIHLGWPGPSLRKILSDDYPFNVTEEEVSYIATIAPVGDIIGGFLGAILVDIIGRKKTLLGLVIPQFLNFLFLYLSHLSVVCLYIGRVFGGISEGAALNILPIYIGEVADPEVRGIFGGFISMTFILGKLFINVFGSYVEVHNVALICMVFIVLFVLLFMHMPESPYYLLMKNKTTEAEQSLQMLKRKNNVNKELVILSADVQRQMSESGSYSDVFKIESNRKAFLLVNGMFFFQQCSGISAFSMYIQLLIQKGTDLSPVLGSSIIIIVQFVSNIITTSVVDKFGRKPLFIFSSGGCCVLLFSLGVFYTLEAYIDLHNFRWVPLAFLVCFILVFQTGLGCVSNIFVSEMYSNSIKSKALSIGIVMFALGAILSTKFYQVMADNFGLAVPFYCFGFLTGCGVLFFIFLVPETKGKTLEAIQQELKGNKALSDVKA